MALRETVTLHFETRSEGPSLARCVVRSGSQHWESAPGAQRRYLDWRVKNLRVLTLALVRLARWNGRPLPPDQRSIPLLAGYGGSPARGLSSTLRQTAAPAFWLWAMFGDDTDEDGQSALRRLNRWLEFGNVQGKRQHESTTVNARIEELPPEAIEVFLDDAAATGARLDRLERDLSSMVNAGLPPLPAGPGLRVEGYLPSGSRDFRGREETLRTLDAWYCSEENRLFLLRATGGAGKTSLAVEWLSQRSLAGHLRHSLVFSWSFYCQGYGAGGGQLLAKFFDALTDALGITLPVGLAPAEAARRILAAMEHEPTLLFLDGLEVLIDPECPFAGGITNAWLAAVLKGFATNAAHCASWVLITSRLPLPDEAPWSYPAVYQLKLGPMRPAATAGGTPITALAHTMAAALSSDGEEAAALVALLEHEPSSDGIPTLTRRNLERMAGTAGRVLLLAASLFDRPPEWSCLREFLAEAPPIPGLTEGWHDLPDAGWEEVIQHLESRQLLQRDSESCIVVHWRFLECLADELRQGLPDSWVEGHRRLYRYFALQPDRELPETVTEMEPLFRAIWHGCQARDYRQALTEIAFPRVSRGYGGYLLEIGEYQAAVNLLENFSADHLTFPDHCDLEPEMKLTVVHSWSWLLEYIGRLSEAYLCGQEAWNRLQRESGGAKILTVSSHLLHLQLLHGDLQDAPPVLRRLWWALTRQPTSAKGLEVAQETLAMAYGWIGVAAASAYWYRGHNRRPELILRIMLRQCSRAMKTTVRLAPGSSTPWHALLLLDMGRWREVATLLDEPSMQGTAWRLQESGAPHLIRGRTFSAEAAAGKARGRTRLIDAAQEALARGLAAAEENGYCWFQSASHLALAQNHRLAGETDAAANAATTCRQLATEHRLRTMQIDADLLLCRLTGEPPGPEVRQRIKSTEYRRADLSSH